MPNTYGTRTCPTCDAPFVARRANQLYCTPKHRPNNASKGDRGYGPEHQAQRRHWQRRLDAGAKVECHADVCFKPGQLITKHDDWDMGHTPDRSGWTGPEHPGCNRTEPQLRDQPAASSKPKRWEM